MSTEWVRADLANLAPCRRRLGEWLSSRLGPDHERLEEIVLVFSELLTNAIVASPPQGEVRCSYSGDRQGIKLRVVNNSDGEIPPELISMPLPGEVDGRGLPLIQEFADHMDLTTNGREVDIDVRFYL